MIEPAAGATRTAMAFLMAAYDEEEVKGETRVVLRLHHRIAPYKVAVLPLSKKAELSEPARALAADLRGSFMCDYDETQSIGRRYRRQDELGTPYCITMDFDSLEDHAVTVRERDSMEQERIAIAEVAPTSGSAWSERPSVRRPTAGIAVGDAAGSISALWESSTRTSVGYVRPPTSSRSSRSTPS